MKRIIFDEKNRLVNEKGKDIKEISDDIKNKFKEMISYIEKCYDEGMIIDRGEIKKIS